MVARPAEVGPVPERRDAHVVVDVSVAAEESDVEVRHQRSPRSGRRCRPCGRRSRRAPRQRSASARARSPASASSRLAGRRARSLSLRPVGEREDAVAAVGQERRHRRKVHGAVGGEPVDEDHRVWVLRRGLQAKSLEPAGGEFGACCPARPAPSTARCTPPRRQAAANGQRGERNGEGGQAPHRRELSQTARRGAPVRSYRLVAVVVGLERAVDRHAEVVGLLGVSLVSLTPSRRGGGGRPSRRASSAARRLPILGTPSSLRPQRDLRDHLVRERVRHHERRVAGRAAEVHRRPAREQR